MRILFTNDDGYDSIGIHAVADLFKTDNEIAVVAPCGHRDYSTFGKDNDEYYCLNGYITITPLLVDRTDYVALDKIKGVEFKL